MRAYLVFAALAAFSVSPALAETLHFKATLTGPAETPPTDSKETGTVDATYDDATKTLGWTINYSGPHRTGAGGAFPRTCRGWNGGAHRSAADRFARQPDQRVRRH